MPATHLRAQKYNLLLFYFYNLCEIKSGIPYVQTIIFQSHIMGVKYLKLDAYFMELPCHDKQNFAEPDKAYFYFTWIMNNIDFFFSFDKN